MGAERSVTRFGNYRAVEYSLILRGREDGEGGGLTQRVYTSDGTTVGRMCSEAGYLAYSEVCGPSTAGRIAELIRRNWHASEAMLGFEAFQERSSAAVVRFGEGPEEGWATVHLDDQEVRRELEDAPSLSGKEEPTLRLVGGFEAREDYGMKAVDVACELHGSRFLERKGTLGLLDEIEVLELTATAKRPPESGASGEGRVGRRERGLREVKIAKDGRKALEKVSERRGEAQFMLEPTVVSAYREDPSVQLWLLVEFGGSFLSVPRHWRRFWMRLDHG